MLGTPITYLPKFTQGSVGYIVVADTDDLFLDAIDFVQFGIEGDTTATANATSGVNLEILNGYINDSDAPDIAWSFDSSMIYLFLKTLEYPYTSDTKFIVFGKRTGIPITSLNDNIDVPEKHLELYIKYAIKEAAQLSGRLVPPSIEKDIKELETKLGS